MSQNRNFVFTQFRKESGEDSPRLLMPEDFPPWLSYVSYQLEMCPDTDRLHFQGYLECIGKKSFSQLAAVNGFSGAHFEVRRGTQAQAISYTQKEDTRIDGPWVHGQCKVSRFVYFFSIKIVL